MCVDFSYSEPYSLTYFLNKHTVLTRLLQNKARCGYFYSFPTLYIYPYQS